MQVVNEQIDPCKVQLTITVGEEHLEGSRKKAEQQAIAKVQLPGFRRGKVPAQMALKYVDPGAVRQRAVEMAVPEIYKAALEQEGVVPFHDPEFEFVEYPEGGELVFKATVPLAPNVELGQYKGLAVEKRNLIITDADVNEQVEQLRARHSQFEVVEGAVSQTGDMVLVDLTATVEGKDLPELAEPKATVIEIGRNIPDLDNGLVGLSAGDVKTIEAIYPTDFPDETLQGKKATFGITVTEVRQKNLPELTDEFAAKAHPTAKTVDELLVAIREGLTASSDEMSNNELDVKLVQAAVANATVNFPDILLRAEVEAEARQLEERLREQNITVEQYLAATGKSVEQILDEMSAGARVRIANSLTLAQIAREESITVDDADVDAQIEARAVAAKVSAGAVRKYAEQNNTLNQYRDQAMTQKILAFLRSEAVVSENSYTADEMRAANEAATSVEAVAADTAAEEAPAKPKRKTAKAKDAADDATTANADATAEAKPAPRKRAKKADAEAEG